MNIDRACMKSLNADHIAGASMFKIMGNVNLLDKICGKTGHMQLVCKSKKVCRSTSDPNADVKAIAGDTSKLPLSILPQNSSHVFKTVISASGQTHEFIVDTDFEEVETYQDDDIVHAAGEATRDMRLLSLLNRFFLFGVAIHRDKYTFGVSSFSCVGYIVDGSGCKPNRSRLSPLINAPSPTNLQELHSVLGALQNHSGCIPNFAKHASVLFDVTPANQFSWSSNHEKMLPALPSHLRTAAVLKPFSTKHHSTVIIDASPTGIEAVLEACGRPVICISRRLSKAERGYSQTQREARAVYWTVKRLHGYLSGSNFTIATDHEALKFLYHPTKSLAKSSAAMVQRWIIALSSSTRLFIVFMGSDLRPATGIILSSSGKGMVTILDLDDLSSHRGHIDQVESNTRGQSVIGTPAVSNTNGSFADDHMVSERNVISDEHTTNEEPEVSNLRRSEQLRSRSPLNYKHPYADSRCGGCDEHDLFSIRCPIHFSPVLIFQELYTYANSNKYVLPVTVC
ncbi:retrovirus-related Pol polyprotein from transposon 17.6 [Clonorchis sinensis]|uniref:Retrovirus-related Pol polyprotein from transposon 17.6 n=1 Tax=Clonorchis sinensis TaxID=79923 RepID=G7YM42_CLOSI|nr:retrovirus-related Pol polyprotein from transposon 17.6 [Clonorchis sinensis]